MNVGEEKKKKGLKSLALEWGWIAENGKSIEDNKCIVAKKGGYPFTFSKNQEHGVNKKRKKIHMQQKRLKKCPNQHNWIN